MNFFLTIILILFFFSCDSSTEPDIAEDFTSLIWVTYNQENNYLCDTLSERLRFSAVLIGPQIQEINEIGINGINLIQNDDFVPSYVNEDCEDADINYYITRVLPGYSMADGVLFSENFSTINFNISTDFVNQNGNISVPSIDSLIFFEVNTENRTLNSSWTGNADFYEISIDYSCLDSLGNYLVYDYETEFVKTNSFSHATDCLELNYDYIQITPWNGPFPEEGASHNMEGDGNGYLYISGDDLSTYNNFNILNSINNSQKYIKNIKYSQYSILEKLNLIK